MCGLILLDISNLIIKSTVACKAYLVLPFLNSKAPEKIIRFSYIQNILRFPFHLDAKTKRGYTTGQKINEFFHMHLENMQKCAEM